MTKILLVEDDKSLREIYGVRLYSEGYDIISAGDGEEALAMAIKERPQLILSDVMMPKISGFDMLDILRSTTETRDIKVIMMTALSSEDQRLRGEQLGADRYLVKSQVGIEDVVRTVHEVLGDAPTNASSSGPAPAGQPSFQSQPAAPSGVNVPARPVATPTPPVPQAQPPAVAQTSAPANTPATPQPQQPQSPAPVQPEPDNNQLPQPTAPFSTPRPSNLGDRIIQPLDTAESSQEEDLASRMERELADSLGIQPQAPAPAQTPAPASPSVAQATPQESPFQTPATNPEPVSQPALTSPPVEPQPLAVPDTPPQPQTEQQPQYQPQQQPQVEQQQQQPQSSPDAPAPQAAPQASSSSQQ